MQNNNYILSFFLLKNCFNFYLNYSFLNLKLIFNYFFNFNRIFFKSFLKIFDYYSSERSEKFFIRKIFLLLLPKKIRRRRTKKKRFVKSLSFFDNLNKYFTNIDFSFLKSFTNLVLNKKRTYLTRKYFREIIDFIAKITDDRKNIFKNEKITDLIEKKYENNAKFNVYNFLNKHIDPDDEILGKYKHTFFLDLIYKNRKKNNYTNNGTIFLNLFFFKKKINIKAFKFRNLKVKQALHLKKILKEHKVEKHMSFFQENFKKCQYKDKLWFLPYITIIIYLIEPRPYFFDRCIIIFIKKKCISFLISFFYNTFYNYFPVYKKIGKKLPVEHKEEWAKKTTPQHTFYITKAERRFDVFTDNILSGEFGGENRNYNTTSSDDENEDVTRNNNNINEKIHNRIIYSDSIYSEDTYNFAINEVFNTEPGRVFGIFGEYEEELPEDDIRCIKENPVRDILNTYFFSNENIYNYLNSDATFDSDSSDDDRDLKLNFDKQLLGFNVYDCDSIENRRIEPDLILDDDVEIDDKPELAELKILLKNFTIRLLTCDKYEYDIHKLLYSDIYEIIFFFKLNDMLPYKNLFFFLTSKAPDYDLLFFFLNSNLFVKNTKVVRESDISDWVDLCDLNNNLFFLKDEIIKRLPTIPVYDKYIRKPKKFAYTNNFTFFFTRLLRKYKSKLVHSIIGWKLKLFTLYKKFSFNYLFYFNFLPNRLNLRFYRRRHVGSKLKIINNFVPYFFFERKVKKTLRLLQGRLRYFKYMFYYNEFLITSLETFLNLKFFLKIYSLSRVIRKYKFNRRLNFIKNKFRKFSYKIGKGFFLAEAIDVILLTFMFKDVEFFVYWLQKTMNRIFFKKHKAFLHFLRIYLIHFFCKVFNRGLKFKGFYFDIRGKVGVAGNAKKRHTLLNWGETSFTKKDLKLKYTQGLVFTHTGVLGLTFIITY